MLHSVLHLFVGLLAPLCFLSAYLVILRLSLNDGDPVRLGMEFDLDLDLERDRDRELLE